jgi:HSP20 family protein
VGLRKADSRAAAAAEQFVKMTSERTFTLPATVDAANIKAQYENGVLTVTLPKVEKAKPRQIQVEVAKA